MSKNSKDDTKDHKLKNFYFTSVKKKLLISILLVSSITTTILTGISFYLDYSEEMDILENSFEHIKLSSLPTLREALWSENTKDVINHVESLLRITDVVKAVVVDENGEIIYQGINKNGDTRYLVSKAYKLTRKSNDNIFEVGILRVTATKANIYYRLKRKLLYFFFSQGVKTFLVSFLMLLIFSHFVTGHLIKIVSYLNDFNLASTEIKEPLKFINKNKGSSDELDMLASSVNDLCKVIVTNNMANQSKLVSKDKEIENQKSNALNSARLASLGEMACNMAHEINNPLAIISLYSDKIKTQAKKDMTDLEKIKKSNIIIKETVYRIKNIIDGLKNVSRDAENDPYRPCSVGEIINDVFSICSEKLRSKGVNLEKTYTDVEPTDTIECRQVQIGQVLLNLVNNAFDAIVKTSSPWIRTEIKNCGSSIEISVIDSGMGIPENIQHKILEPFFTTKEIGAGTGLGLSISSKIIKEHNGEFFLDRKDSHTKFTIILPRVASVEQKRKVIVLNKKKVS